MKCRGRSLQLGKNGMVRGFATRRGTSPMTKLRGTSETLKGVIDADGWREAMLHRSIVFVGDQSGGGCGALRVAPNLFQWHRAWD
jgi:hypothetical protein